ncbi:hypothetical protein ACHAXT_008063 [Thalassiosira profunda]
MATQLVSRPPSLPTAAAAPSSSKPQCTPVLPPPPPLGLPSGHFELIDNSALSYTSVKLRCGVTVQVGENVLEDCPGILDDLNHDIIGCLSVLPASCRQLLRRTKIWINRTIRDRQEKEESIEIYNAAEYQRMRLHYQSYGLLLHEFCHIVHQKALPGGLYNSTVVDIHRIAKESGKYAKVLRRDWALKEVDTDMAYAIVDHKEFFAEISVSFLADFYHERDHGAGAATSMSMATCSPPFVSLAVIERMRQQSEKGSQSSCSGLCRAMSLRRGGRIIPHCSKFFPFTKGQLRRYDPRVYKCFVKLWQCIEGWEDPVGQRCYSCEWF